MSLASLDLDLDVFSGPFDLLLTLVLREEVDLLELALADVVLAYLDHLEQRGELDLEAATEFIVLIAALLELKSRLMLSGEEEELLDIEPEQAAEDGSASPDVLGAAIGRLLSMPPEISVRHIGTPRVSVAERLAHLRGLLRRGAFSFEEAVAGADRMTVAVTLFALLELYKLGEAGWEQRESFGDISIRAAASQPPREALAPATRVAARLAG